MGFTMPEGFLFGVSTAATQIEGGEVGSNWNDWYHRGRIKDGSDPAVADGLFLVVVTSRAAQLHGVCNSHFQHVHVRLGQLDGLLCECASPHHDESEG